MILFLVVNLSRDPVCRSVEVLQHALWVLNIAAACLLVVRPFLNAETHPFNEKEHFFLSQLHASWFAQPLMLMVMAGVALPKVPQ